MEVKENMGLPQGFNARRVKCFVDIDPIGFTDEELAKADYFEIGGEIAEKGVVVYCG